jgi:hypothetical protein
LTEIDFEVGRYIDHCGLARYISLFLQFILIFTMSFSNLSEESSSLDEALRSRAEGDSPVIGRSTTVGVDVGSNIRSVTRGPQGMLQVIAVSGNHGSECRAYKGTKGLYFCTQVREENSSTCGIAAHAKAFKAVRYT